MAAKQAMKENLQCTSKYGHLRISQDIRHVRMTDIEGFLTIYGHSDNLLNNKHTYIHTYIRRYVHTYIHACMHAYMHACMHTYIHTLNLDIETGSRTKFVDFIDRTQ